MQNGTGAKDFGLALSETDAFCECAVKRVWKVACLRDPIKTQDGIQGEEGVVKSLCGYFRTTLQYNLKRLFEVVATRPECLAR